jgi:hypothetical protein
MEWNGSLFFLYYNFVCVCIMFAFIICYELKVKVGSQFVLKTLVGCHFGLKMKVQCYYVWVCIMFTFISCYGLKVNVGCQFVLISTIYILTYFRDLHFTQQFHSGISSNTLYATQQTSIHTST